ncbi:MAG: histidine phosphatase family protein [Alphaproteobacteria bacterium]|nr:histidine phosphatase family protein [Alphaproteobacteria bacterium]
MEREVTGRQPGSIHIARHGRPALDRSVKIDWRAFRDWWAQYDASGLADGQVPPPALCEAARRSDVLFSSTLRRSIETAAAVAEGREVLQDPVFVEAPLPPPRIPGRRSPDAWGVWSRAAWWMGDSKEMESREAAELRAEAAVATLTARALRGETVMLLAHGWFNRMMRPVLRAQGWRCVRDGGDGYWSFRTYQKTL